MSDIVETPKIGLKGRLAWCVVNPDGTTEQHGAKDNLILDQGLDYAAQYYFADIFKYCAVGTGQVAPAVTNTALGAETARTNNYITNPTGECGTTTPTATSVELKRTFQFPAGTLDGTYYEVGMSPLPSAGANLFSRALFTTSGVPTGVAVTAVQELRVVYTLTVSLSPSAITAGSLDIVGMAGTPFSYTHAVQMNTTPNGSSDEYVYGTVAMVGLHTNGNTNSTSAGYSDHSTLEPLGIKTIGLHQSNTPLTVPGAVSSHLTPITPNSQGIAPEVYIAGSFQRDYVFTASANNFNSPNIYGLFIGGPYFSAIPTPDSNYYHSYRLQFDSPITKVNTHELTFTIRISWGRA